MLGGQREGLTPTDMLSYSPTTAQSFAASLEQPWRQAQQLLDYVAPGLTGEEERKKNAESLQYINEIVENPNQSLAQQGANMIGNLVSSLIPTLPFTLASGLLVKGVAGAIGFGARQAAIEATSDTLLATYLRTQVPLNKLVGGAGEYFLPKAPISKIATGIATGFAEYKGFTIPEHFAENYNAINNSLDKSKALEDWGSDNYGFLLAGLPLAAGYVAYKGVRGSIALRQAHLKSQELDTELGRLLREHHETLSKNEKDQLRVSELQDHLQQAEDEGHISADMHEWYLDYLENPNEPKVHEAALKVLQQMQIPYDRITGKVWHQVISREGLQNLKQAAFDEGLTNFSAPDNQLFTGYIAKNELDSYVKFMKEHPTMLDAVRGMTHHLTTQLEEHAGLLRAFDENIARKLPQGLLKKQIFSQNNIFQHLKKLGIHSIRDIPYHVPKDVAFKLKLEHQIKMIKGRSTPKYQKLFDEGKHLELKERIKSIKLPTPAEELEGIKNKLMPEGRLIGDYKNRKAYHRLEDLSQVWPQAKVLFDRIEMESYHAKQQGLNNILKSFTEVVDNTATRLADPDSVKKYLSERMEQSVPFVREFEQYGISLEPIKEDVIKSAGEELLNSPERIAQVKEAGFKEANEAFELSDLKLKQFKGNEKALKELMDCMTR